MNRDEGFYESVRPAIGRQAVELAGGEGALISTVSIAETWCRRLLTIFTFDVIDGEVYARPRSDVGSFRPLGGGLLAAWGADHAKGRFEALDADEWAGVADQVRATVLAAHAAAQAAVPADAAAYDEAARARAEETRRAELRRQREAVDAELAALDEAAPVHAGEPTEQHRGGMFRRGTSTP